MSDQNLVIDLEKKILNINEEIDEAQKFSHTTAEILLDLQNQIDSIMMLLNVTLDTLDKPISLLSKSRSSFWRRLWKSIMP